MQQPSEADIESAKEYLRQRLECENAMTVLLESAMREAAKRIVSILFAAKMPAAAASFDALPVAVQVQVDDVVEWLRGKVEDYFQTLAIADHEENRNQILSFVLDENHGRTFDERLSGYCENFRDELMILIGAGLLLGISEVKLAKSIGDNLKRPYANQLLAEGIGVPVSYGKGRTNSMFTAINTLARFGISKAWMYDRHLKAEMERAQGFITFRNSSWPCEQCDEYASNAHPMDDEIPPIHANCVCGTIYFNVLGEPIRF